MAELKLTKNELRLQQNRLSQLLKYLPTLQLKKALLQIEVNEARAGIARLQDICRSQRDVIDEFSKLLSDEKAFDPVQATKIQEIKKSYENIAGVEAPSFVDVVFADFHYDLFDTPVWVDTFIAKLRLAAKTLAEISVAEEKKLALEKELRDVSIRVNLFEKILIPRANKNIKKIKVFLGDQQLAAVSQAKVAKDKIEELKLAVMSARV